MMSYTPTSTHTWVAFGPAGVIGSIHPVDGGYSFRLTGESTREAAYPTLEIAKRALVATLPVGSDWPEFREH
jgi:hypothetical protein